MTCICGTEYDGKVWLAGDAETSSKSVRHYLALPKVWEKDGLVWGFAGDSRPTELVRHAFRAPKRNPNLPISAYVVNDIVPALRTLYKSDGCESGWSALLGVEDELWELDSDGYLTDRAAEGYSAVGSAQSAAMVGLALTTKLAPRTRLTRVVAACSRHCPGVGGRITVVHTT